MTRTFVVGEVPEAVRAQEALVREAIERAREATRPGVSGRELHALVCEVFEAAGHRTQRTGPGEDPNEGFQFSLGHGVGLEVHEEPEPRPGRPRAAGRRATCSRSSPASGSARSAACASRTCCW